MLQNNLKCIIMQQNIKIYNYYSKSSWRLDPLSCKRLCSALQWDLSNEHNNRFDNIKCKHRHHITG